MEDKILFMDRLAAQLVHWEQELEELKICVDQATTVGKTDLHERMTELRTKQEATKAKLAQFRASGDEAWDETRAGIEKSWGEPRTALASAWTKLWDES